MQRIQGFGWRPDKPDFRDRKFRLAAVSAVTPSFPPEGGANPKTWAWHMAAIRSVYGW